RRAARTRPRILACRRRHVAARGLAPRFATNLPDRWRRVESGRLRVFVPRLLIKSKQTLPLAVSAAAAALALALLCGLLVTTASARTGPRVGVGYATPVERSPLNRSVLRFQRVVTALATQILIDEVERERRA